MVVAAFSWRITGTLAPPQELLQAGHSRVNFPCLHLRFRGNDDEDEKVERMTKCRQCLVLQTISSAYRVYT